MFAQHCLDFLGNCLFACLLSCLSIVLIVFIVFIMWPPLLYSLPWLTVTKFLSAPIASKVDYVLQHWAAFGVKIMEILLET